VTLLRSALAGVDAFTRHDRQILELRDEHRREFAQLVDRDPIVNSVVASRLRTARSLAPSEIGGALFGVYESGVLAGAALSGSNLVAIGGDRDIWTALARRVGDLPRTCTSIVGRSDAVARMWRELSKHWAARAVRAEQPLLLLDRPGPPIAGDVRLRAMDLSDLDRYLVAAAAMFTEELGMSPLGPATRPGYHRRVRSLITAGRAFGIVGEDGAVVFKADLAAVSAHTCQVQGVWVRPDLRGRGLGTAALAAVLHRALRLAPTVSLYVNDFNVPARRAYERVGLSNAGTFASVLF